MEVQMAQEGNERDPMSIPVEYKVPRILWENLEAVLLAQSRRFIKELAEHIKVPEKELQRKVLPDKDSLKVMIQDAEDPQQQCTAYVQHEKMTTFCRKPVAYGSTYCAFHRIHRTQILPTNPIEIQKLPDRPDQPPLWLKGNLIVNAQGHTVGKVNHSTRTIKRFIT